MNARTIAVDTEIDAAFVEALRSIGNARIAIEIRSSQEQAEFVADALSQVHELSARFDHGRSRHHETVHALLVQVAELLFDANRSSDVASLDAAEKILAVLRRAWA